VHAFGSNEELHYSVTYNWGMIWLESGYASFTVKYSRANNRNQYSMTGKGNTYPRYDWFYKVRDLFESTVDSATLRPLRFRAVINEGSKNDEHNYIFNQASGKAYAIINRGRKKVTVDTLQSGACTVDVLTAIYHARSIDYSPYKVNDTIGMSLLIDGKIYPIYIRYLGKDTYSSNELGKYRCVKFSPLLVEGSIFKKGEGMTVWVSDDSNKLPLFIETPIIVGNIQVKLVRFKGLKHPQKAKMN
jgi:hypothetical protein